MAKGWRLEPGRHSLAAKGVPTGRKAYLATTEATRTERREIAQTIYQQLGGGRFKAMTGANQFVYDDKAIWFRIPQAGKGINYVKVTLTPADTYDVEFGRVFHKEGIPDYKVISKVDGIYADQLQTVFEDETGLATHL